jgi:hypothetical protein
MANEMFAVVKDTVLNATTQANAAQEKISAATVDTKSLVHEIRDSDENVTDATVLAFRAKHEAALAEIESWVSEVNDYIKANLLPSANADVDVEALKAEYKEAVSLIKASKTFAAKLGAPDDLWSDVPALKTLRGGTSGAGSGAGGKRPRLESIYVDGQRIHETTGEGDKARDVSTFTLAARFMSNKEHANNKADVRALQEAAFAAAGTDDLSGHEAFDFVYSPDGGKHSYTVKVVPQDNEAAKTETPAESETDATE